MIRKISWTQFALVASLATAACSPKQFAAIQTNSGSQVQVPSDGSDVLKATESFTQDEAANKIDILIINDNSYSMEVEQTKMAERFPAFVSSFSGLDYQISMTTTDIDSTSNNLNLGGRVVNWSGTASKFLTGNSSNAATLFRNTLRRIETIGCTIRGDCPSGNEQPLKAAMLAMDQRLTSNAGVFRNKTDLAIVVLSDEDELSDGPANATKPQEVVDRFKAHFGDSKRLAVFGIVIKSGDEACRIHQLAQTSGGKGAYFATHVEELARLTGGSVNSICDDDYSQSLTDISNSVRKLVGTFDLHQAPKPGTVEVVMTPHQVIGFRVEGKKVIFDTPPPAGTRVEISYQY